MAWTYSLTYTQVNDYSVKDGLSSGDPEKIILGADVDDELSGIATALNSKLDAGSVSSQAEAEGGTDTESVMTPQGVQYWGDANGGHVGELRLLSDPAADAILYYDFSAGAGSMVSQLSIGDGLQISANTLQLPSSLAGDGLTLTSGVLDVGAGAGISVSGSQVSLTDAAATTSNPIDISSGAFSLDLTALTAITGAGIAGADLLIIDDGASNTHKKIAYQDFGIPQTDDATTTPFSSADLSYANRWYNCNNASAISAVIPANASVAYPVGTVFAFHQRGAGQITVSVTSDTLRSPNGAKTAGQYSTIFATKIGTTEWVITGDAAS